MRRWVDVATLARTKGSNGRLVAHCAAGLSFMLQPGDAVAFVPPQLDMARRATVVQSSPIGEGRYEVVFEGVSDRATAEALVSCHCLVRREDVGDALADDSPAAWLGWTVVDGAGAALGQLSGMVDKPGQALLEVDRADGAGSLLVPLVDQIVVGVDAHAHILHVQLPDGLLDL